MRAGDPRASSGPPQDHDGEGDDPQVHEGRPRDHASGGRRDDDCRHVHQGEEQGHVEELVPWLVRLPRQILAARGAPPPPGDASPSPPGGQGGGATRADQRYSSQPTPTIAAKRMKGEASNASGSTQAPPKARMSPSAADPTSWRTGSGNRPNRIVAPAKATIGACIVQGTRFAGCRDSANTIRFIAGT